MKEDSSNSPKPHKGSDREEASHPKDITNNTSKDNSNTSSGTGRKVPKRVITEKIEEIFHTIPTQEKSFKEKVKYLFFEKLRINQRKFLLSILILMGVLLILGWVQVVDLFFKSEVVEIVSFNPLYKFEAYGSIVSTPILNDLNQDKYAEIVFADLLGNVYALNYQGNLLFRYNTKQGVIASLSSVDADQAHPLETLVVTETGEFFVLNQAGNYLYRSRSEYFSENIQAKPAFAPGEKGEDLILLGGRNGTLWGVNARYGEVVWMNDHSPLKQQKIFASPLLIKHQESVVSDRINANRGDLVVFLSESGNLVATRKDNGFLVWHLDLNDKFKASMTIGSFLSPSSSDQSIGKDARGQLVLTSLSGKVYLVSMGGKVISISKINGSIISSPTKGRFTLDGVTRVYPVILTEAGKIYLLKVTLPTETEDGEIETNQPSNLSGNSDIVVEPILWMTLDDTKFISSPLVFDFNKDGIDDILIISRIGKIYLIDGVNRKMINAPFELDFQVTASPLVADLTGNGELELVVAGENGQLVVLAMEYFPKVFFQRHSVVQGEFLRDSYNHN